MHACASRAQGLVGVPRNETRRIRYRRGWCDPVMPSSEGPSLGAHQIERKTLTNDGRKPNDNREGFRGEDSHPPDEETYDYRRLVVHVGGRGDNGGTR